MTDAAMATSQEAAERTGPRAAGPARGRGSADPPVRSMTSQTRETNGSFEAVAALAPAIAARSEEIDAAGGCRRIWWRS